MWPVMPEHAAILTRGVRAPLTQPALVDGLDSWYLKPGYLDMGVAGFDKSLFEGALDYMKTLEFDQRYDRSDGMHGRLVLHSSTRHPRPYRVEFGVCHGRGGGDCGMDNEEGVGGEGFWHGGDQVGTERCSQLVSYPATCTPPQLWSKRHVPPRLYALVAHVCTLLRPHIPSLQQADPFPNSITLHWYPSCRTPGNERGDTRVGYHTDSYSHTGRRVAQRDGTPVISISWGETMWFWTQRGTRETVTTALEHGSVWVWSSRDDKSGVKHSVCYPSRPEPAARGGRWVLVCRWVDTLRLYDQCSPYRNLSGHDCVWL